MYDVYTNKSNQKQKILIGGIAAVIIVIIGIVAFFFLNKNDEAKVLQQYYAYIEKGDFDKITELIDEESLKSYGKEALIERNQKIYEGMEVSNIVFKEINQEKKDDKEVLEYTVQMKTFAGDLEFDSQVSFVDGKIEWNDMIIHPQLKKDYKVKVATTQPTRGRIIDRNGVVLAGEGEAYSVGLVPQKLDGEKDYEKIGSLLGLSGENVKSKMSAKWIKPDSFVPLKIISKEAQTTTEALLKISGVKLSTTHVRSYPFKKATSHVIGYMQKVTAEDLEKHKGEGYTETSYIGKSGIEAAYEKELKGTAGARIYIVDSTNLEVSTIVQRDTQNGKDIQLTLDASLQRDLYDQFQNDKSASVALNPKTGEVLALVSTPTFSSSDFIYGFSNEQWKALNDDKDKPLYNRFKATWAPGSTMKPVTGAIGLESGKLDPQKDLGAQMKWQKDSSWGSYFVTTLHAPNPNQLRNALIQSDNVYFAKAALQIGSQELEKGYKALKIGEKIPFELSLNNSQYTSQDFDDPIQVADSGYGQGQVLMNPLQLTSLYSGFVNEGKIMTPYLIKETKTSVWIDNAYAKNTVTEIKSALVRVVKDASGTAHSLNNTGLSIAGKTGTAEIKASQTDTSGTELGWFTVMNADANSDKQIVITTMVEDVKNKGGSGYVVNRVKTPLTNYLK